MLTLDEAYLKVGVRPLKKIGTNQVFPDLSRDAGDEEVRQIQQTVSQKATVIREIIDRIKHTVDDACIIDGDYNINNKF